MSRWDDYPTTSGVVVSVDTTAGLAIVNVAGAQIPAWMPDHVWLGTVSGPAVGPGVTVTLLRVLGGYQVVSVFSGTEGGGGPTLGPELLANGGFESGPESGTPTGWSVLWASLFTAPRPYSVGTETPFEGARYVRVTTDPAYDHSATISRTIASRIDPGLTYRLAGMVRGSTDTGTPTVGIEAITGPTDADAKYFGAGEGSLQVVATLASPGGAWQVLAGDFTVPASHTYIRVGVRTTATPGTDARIDIDALSLKQRLA